MAPRLDASPEVGAFRLGGCDSVGSAGLPLCSADSMHTRCDVARCDSGLGRLELLEIGCLKSKACGSLTIWVLTPRMVQR